MKSIDYEDMPDEDLRFWLKSAHEYIGKDRTGFRNVQALRMGAITTVLKRLDELDSLKAKAEAICTK